MDKIKKNFGFGFMRLPMNGEEVDIEQSSKMVDMFMERGFNYFDTAHGYIDGKSELAIKECLSSRYPRESYVLTNKLTDEYFKSQEDIRPLFESQLEACGVEYFDFYLMHSQNGKNYEHYKKCNAYETALELKTEGKIRHFGISFHDSAEVLRRILSDYPQIEVVQIQFNYVDYHNSAVQSRKVYEVCREFNKPVIVMEPVKGGHLANLPEKARAEFDKLGNASSASYALRYAAGFEGMLMVLSGMGSIEQMEDNTSFMAEFQPLSQREQEAIDAVREVFNSMGTIQCTGCRYCVEGCPKNIPIPDVFGAMNAKKVHPDWNADFYYRLHTRGKGRASACIKCGKCEKICPQHLNIRELLETVAETFETKKKAE